MLGLVKINELTQELEYKVEDIIDYYLKKGYLIKWLGYNDIHNTWELREHLTNAPEILESFLRLRRTRKGSANH